MVNTLRTSLVDGNNLSRFWPALALATAILVGGAALAPRVQRESDRFRQWRGLDAIEREAWDEAAAELELALDQDPTQASASLYFYLGYARNELGQPQQAAEAYEAALEFDAGDSPTHWNLALTYVELDRHAEALSHFETYLALNPGEAAEVQPYIDALRLLVP
jgi:tetratricopeptide (TPR) repeat protein